MQEKSFACMIMCLKRCFSCPVSQAVCIFTDGTVDSSLGRGKGHRFKVRLDLWLKTLEIWLCMALHWLEFASYNHSFVGKQTRESWGWGSKQTKWRVNTPWRLTIAQRLADDRVSISNTRHPAKQSSWAVSRRKTPTLTIIPFAPDNSKWNWGHFSLIRLLIVWKLFTFKFN